MEAQCKAMQVNLWCGQLCWAMHDLAIKAPLTNVTLFRTMHSHTSTCLTFYKARCNLMKMCIMLDLLQNSWHVDVSISKAKRKSQIYHTCHLTRKCRAFNLRRKHDFGWTAPWWLKLLSFGDRLDLNKGHGRCRDITATRGQGFRGQGQGYYCLSQEFFGLSASAGCGIVTVLGIFLLF